MLLGEHIPVVRSDASMEEAVLEMDRPNLGVTFVVDGEKRLCGIVTDGDIRRLVVQKKTIQDLRVEEVMTKNPLKIGPDSPAYDALNLMEKHQITVLPAVNARGEIQGILHLHDILGKGQFKFNNT